MKVIFLHKTMDIMNKRIFTLACVTAISLTTACIACSCGTNPSHAKNDVYYTERNISSPQDRARDMLPPMTDETPSDSVPDSSTISPAPTPTPLPMPAPKPLLPGFPHRRPLPPPPSNSAPDCSDGSCDESGDEPDSSTPSQSAPSSDDESAEGQKRERKRLYSPKEDPVAKAD